MDKNILLTPKFLIISAVSLLFFAIIAILFVNYIRVSSELAAIKSDPGKIQDLSKNEIRKVLDAVGKLMVLPSDDEPTVATVTDVEKLREQAFFTNAQNGDKVIIFAKAKKAVLYRPQTNQIIDVAPVDLAIAPTSAATSSAGTETGPSPTPTFPPIRINILNGTEINGLTKQAEDDIKKIIPKVDIVKRDFAKNRNYEKTLVVDLTGQNKIDSQRIANALKGKVELLPKGEDNPNQQGTIPLIDVLIILGADRVPSSTPSAAF